MGKKDKKNKGSKADKKLQKKVAELIDGGDITFDDLIEAGVGVLADAVADKKMKRFDKMRRRGAALDIVIEVSDADPAEIAGDGGALDDEMVEADEDAAPMGEVEHRGGGWFDIVIAGVPTDRVRGREAAEARLIAISELA